MLQKINLAVIMGGPGSEHEVSLNSGVSILDALDKNKYNVKIVKIEKDGRWLISPYIPELKNKNDVKLINDSVAGLRPLDANLAVEKIEDEKVDVVFIAMHGQIGEDGTMQALLDFAGIPYQGSGLLASALAMDKIKSAELFAFHDLDVPKYFAFGKKNLEKNKEKIKEFLKNNLPAVLKPSDGGSSAGTFLIKNEEEFKKRLPQSFAVSKNLMLQEFISGDEITCGVLDADGEPVALPPTKIIANSGEFYDYTSKYAAGGSTHIVPAPFPEDVIKKIQETALKAHQILGCHGLSRTDMILNNGRLYLLETNTLPGMTKTSLFPEQAKAAGIPFTTLLDKLIQSALAKK